MTMRSTQPQHDRALRRGPPVVFRLALTALLTITACKAGPGSPCTTTGDCQDALVCFVPSELPDEVATRFTFDELALHLPQDRCVSTEDLQRAGASVKAALDAERAALAAAEARCRVPCKHFGRCTPTEDDCIATNEPDCLRSRSCTLAGFCTPKDGKCIVGKDADCQASGWCKSFGRCTAGPEKCTVGSDEECQNSNACKSFRQCRAKDGRCVR